MWPPSRGSSGTRFSNATNRFTLPSNDNQEATRSWIGTESATAISPATRLAPTTEIGLLMSRSAPVASPTPTFQTRTGKEARATRDIRVMFHICPAVSITPPRTSSRLGETPRKPASTLEVGSSLSGTDWMMVFTVGSSMVLPSRSTVSVAAPSRFARIRSVSSSQVLTR